MAATRRVPWAPNTPSTIDLSGPFSELLPQREKQGNKKERDGMGGKTSRNKFLTTATGSFCRTVDFHLVLYGPPDVRRKAFMFY